MAGLVVPQLEVTMKSQATDLLKVAERVYHDATAKCIADVSDLRDLETMRSRVKDEGISFLTITLPNFCRDFERSLANGFIDSKDFANFKKVKSRSIPAFLQGMVSQIFDRETGRIRNDESNPDRTDLGRDCSINSTIIEHQANLPHFQESRSRVYPAKGQPRTTIFCYDRASLSTAFCPGI